MHYKQSYIPIYQLDIVSISAFSTGLCSQPCNQIQHPHHILGHRLRHKIHTIVLVTISSSLIISTTQCPISHHQPQDRQRFHHHNMIINEAPGDQIGERRRRIHQNRTMIVQLRMMRDHMMLVIILIY